MFTLFSPCRAKLASLFGLDQAGSQGNESFQYTAPKQPRKSSNPGETVRTETPVAPRSGARTETCLSVCSSSQSEAGACSSRGVAGHSGPDLQIVSRQNFLFLMMCFLNATTVDASQESST